MEKLITELEKIYEKLGGTASDIPTDHRTDLEFIVDKIEDKVGNGGGGGSSSIRIVKANGPGQVHEVTHTLYIPTDITIEEYEECFKTPTPVLVFIPSVLEESPYWTYDDDYNMMIWAKSFSETSLYDSWNIVQGEPGEGQVMYLVLDDET